MKYLFPYRDNYVTITRGNNELVVNDGEYETKLLLDELISCYIPEIFSDREYLYFKTVTISDIEIYRLKLDTQEICHISLAPEHAYSVLNFYRGTIYLLTQDGIMSINEYECKECILPISGKIISLSYPGSKFWVMCSKGQYLVVNLENPEQSKIYKLPKEMIPHSLQGNKLLCNSVSRLFIHDLEQNKIELKSLYQKNQIYKSVYGLVWISFERGKVEVFSFSDKEIYKFHSKSISILGGDHNPNTYIDVYHIKKPIKNSVKYLLGLPSNPGFEFKICRNVGCNNPDVTTELCSTIPDIQREYLPGVTISPVSYTPGHCLSVKYNLHHGQRKLFLAELQCLNQLTKGIDRDVIVVYPGAAPGYHRRLLAAMFPRVKFHLYDPAKMAFTSHNNLYVYQQFFTDETAAEWRDKADIFISDIRLGPEEGKGMDSVFEQQVEKDMINQLNWARIINPSLGAMFKFRARYLDKETSYFPLYCKGRVMIQCWPPLKSAETRLISTHDQLYQDFQYNANEYQNWMFYHNSYLRSVPKYQPPVEWLNLVEGYDQCFDCTNEALIWTEYLGLNNIPESFRYLRVDQLMNLLTKNIRQTLISDKSKHGQ